MKENLLGKTFGRLTVISESKESLFGFKPVWLCRCICGTEKLVIASPLRNGKTQSCGCLLKEIQKNFGRKGNNRKNGRHKNNGYINILNPDHPNSQKRGYIRESALVMSNYLGRPLKPREIIHHKNGIRDDNRIENLELWISGHPPGQRVNDLVAFALDILQTYQPQLLKKKLQPRLFP